jgi:hypothetical protein
MRRDWEKKRDAKWKKKEMRKWIWRTIVKAKMLESFIERKTTWSDGDNVRRVLWWRCCAEREKKEAYKAKKEEAYCLIHSALGRGTPNPSSPDPKTLNPEPFFPWGPEP